MKKTVLKILIGAFIFSFASLNDLNAQTVQTVPLYRLLYWETSADDFNNKIIAQQRQHFYTANKAERDGALKNYYKKEKTATTHTESNFKDEGIEGYISPIKLPGTVPLYHLYKDIHRHFYTTDVKEKNNAVQNLGWASKGIVGYVWKTKVAGTTPLYRLYRPENGKLREDHFYTVSENGKFTAIQSAGYTFIKNQCYVMAKQVKLDTTGAIVSNQ
jgi:hypothetical protein